MGSSKGSSGGSKIHDYYGTIAGIIGEGVYDYLSSVIIDGKTVWPVARPWASGQNILLNELRGYAGRVWQCILAHNPSSGSNLPPNPTYWQVYKLDRGVDVVTNLAVDGYGFISIYWGTDAQTQDPRLAAAQNQFNEDHPDYRGICYFVFKNFLFGRERNTAPNVTVIMGRKPKQSVVSSGPDELTDGQANVIATAAELITSPNGLGLDASGLDATSFQDTADALNVSLALCSPLLDEQAQMRAWAAKLAEVADAWLRFNPSTGKIEAGFWLHGEAPSSYHTVLESHLTEKAEFDGEGWDAAKTRAFVSFIDRSRNYKQRSEKYDDPRAFKVLTEHRAQSLERPFITRPAQAIQHAAEWVRIYGCPQSNGNLTIRREHARAIRPGDYALVPINAEPGSVINQFVRIIERQIPFKGPIKFRVDVDESLAAQYADVDDDNSADLDDEVPEFVNARIIEAPVALSDYQADHILIFAERPHEIISGFQAYFDTDTGGTFQIIGDSHGFATRATLRSDFSDAETGDMEITVPAQVDTDRLTENTSDLKASDDQLLAVLVDVASGFVDEDSDDYGAIEVCSISNITLVSGSDYDLTVLRARRGTKQRSYVVADTEVWIIPRSSLLSFTHAKLAEIRRNRITGDTPDTGFIRLAPYTTSNSRDLADCASIEFRLPKASTAGPQLELTAPTTDPYQWPPNWNSGTAYVEGDWVWSGGAAYECVLAHTNQIPPNVTYWQTGNPYPVDINFAGTWTDPNEDMTAFQMWLEKDGVGGEVLDEDDAFSPQGDYPFDEDVHIAESGTWRVRIVATDAIGLKSERTITIVGMDSNTQVAKPKFKAFHGKKLKGTEWNFHGKIKLKCSTPGASIFYRFKIGEDRDWADGDTYISGDKRWHNSVVYLCYSGHVAAAATEPGIGASWTTKWKAAGGASVAWSGAAVAYVAGDKLVNNGVGYMCYSNHTSGATNEPGVGSNWKLRWVYDDEVLSGQTIAAPDPGAFDGLGAWHTYDDSDEGFDKQPYGWDPTDKIREIIEAYATLGGYTDSVINTLTLRFLRVSNSDTAP